MKPRKIPPRHPDAAAAAEWMRHIFGRSMHEHMTRLLRDERRVHVELAARLIVQGEPGRLLQQWRDADRKSPAGRPAELDEVSALALMFACGLGGNTFLQTRIRRLLLQLDETERRMLGIRELPRDLYGAADRAITRLVAIIDPSPGPRKRQSARSKQAILDRQDRVPTLVKEQRLRALMNAIVAETGWRLLPDDLLLRLANGGSGINAVVDATKIEMAGVEGYDPQRGGARTHSANWDAGLWGRTGDHDGSGASAIERALAVELEVLSSTRANPTADEIRTREQHWEAVRQWEADAIRLGWDEETRYARRPRPPAAPEPIAPTLILATDFHLPGKLRGALWRMVEYVLDVVGLAIDHLVGDLAYFPASRPEDAQLPLAQRGIRIISHRKDNQYGVQARFEDVVQINGSWYPEFMPKHLWTLEADHRKTVATFQDIADPAERARRQLEAREALRLQRKRRSEFYMKQKGRTHPDGSRDFFYPDPAKYGPLFDPATGEVLEIKHGSTKRIPARILDPKKKEHTPDDEALRALKYELAYEMHTPKWEIHAGTRSTVESHNRAIKAPQFTNIDDKTSRLVRGIAFALLCASIACGEFNLRQLLHFLQDRIGMGVTNKNREEPDRYLVDEPADADGELAA